MYLLTRNTYSGLKYNLECEGDERSESANESKNLIFNSLLEHCTYLDSRLSVCYTYSNTCTTDPIVDCQQRKQ